MSRVTVTSEILTDGSKSEMVEIFENAITEIKEGILTVYTITRGIAGHQSTKSYNRGRWLSFSAE